MTGSWRRLHNKELRKLYASPHIIRVINREMGGACSMHDSNMNT